MNVDSDGTVDIESQSQVPIRSLLAHDQPSSSYLNITYFYNDSNGIEHTKQCITDILSNLTSTYSDTVYFQSNMVHELFENNIDKKDSTNNHEFKLDFPFPNELFVTENTIVIVCTFFDLLKEEKTTGKLDDVLKMTNDKWNPAGKSQYVTLRSRQTNTTQNSNITVTLFIYVYLHVRV